MSRIWTNSKCVHFKKIVMEKEFLPYEQALALKELGFDEYCLGLYSYASRHTIDMQHVVHTCKASSKLIWMRVPSPLYQQAFRWFRINKKLEYHVKSDMMGYYTYIVDRNIHKTISMGSNIFKTYEEAELACLKKLIELCKKV